MAAVTASGRDVSLYAKVSDASRSRHRRAPVINRGGVASQKSGETYPILSLRPADRLLRWGQIACLIGSQNRRPKQPGMAKAAGRRAVDAGHGPPPGPGVHAQPPRQAAQAADGAEV